MKKFALLLSLVFVAGVAFAQDAAKPAEKAAAPAKAEAAAPAKAAEKAPAVKTHEVTAEVVSVDAVKNTITLKGEKGNNTAPVDGTPQTSLSTIQPGTTRT